MKPRELCERAWIEIAGNFPDFKASKNGQKLKRISANKDIIFEIYFQSSRRNYSCSAEFSVHIGIESVAMKRALINNGFVYGGELEAVISRGRSYRWWQLAGASYRCSVDEICGLIGKFITPIFDDFNDTQSNIDKILNGSILDHNLFYYIYFYGRKDKAYKYFNMLINKSEIKNKMRAFYNFLKTIPRDSIDTNLSEFVGAGMIKFAYLNGIELEK